MTRWRCPRCGNTYNDTGAPHPVAAACTRHGRTPVVMVEETEE